MQHALSWIIYWPEHRNSPGKKFNNETHNMPMLTLFQTIILLLLSLLALSLISTIPYLMVGDTKDFATHEAIFISEIIIDDFYWKVPNM